MAKTILEVLRRLNRGVALAAGLALLVCVAFILVDVGLRQAGRTLGGTNEISGYVMAGITAWGMAYALLEMAHVRIDIVRTQLARPGRLFLDLLAMVSMATTTVLIAVQSWPVLSRTIALGARANTPLETPLWIPQAIWWAGWTWFALTACLTTLCTAWLLVERQMDEAERTVGARSEAEGLS